MSDDTNIPYRKRVFEAFLKYKLKDFTNIFKENNGLYLKLNQKYFTSLRELILKNEGFSKGFIFGWRDEPLTEEDLTYVGPDGEEYNYSEEEKVLGIIL